MINTKIKSMIIAVGLVGLLGCNSEPEVTKYIPVTYQKPARIMEEVYVPLECAEVTRFTSNGTGHAIIDCKDKVGYQLSCNDTGYCFRLMEKRD